MTTMGQHQSCCGSCARQPISESRANLRAGPISERLHGRGSPCAAPCGSRFKPIIRRSERQPTSHTPRESLTRLDTSHNRVTHIAVSDSHSGLGRGAGAEATALYMLASPHSARYGVYGLYRKTSGAGERVAEPFFFRAAKTKISQVRHASAIRVYDGAPAALGAASAIQP